MKRLSEAQVKDLVDTVGISFRGLKRDLRGVFTMVQKRWLANMTRKAKGGKSQ